MTLPLEAAPAPADARISHPTSSHISSQPARHERRRPHPRRRSRRWPAAWTRLPTLLGACLLAALLLVEPASAAQGVLGPDQLYTASVAYCSPPEVILISNLGLRFFRENRTLEFDIAASSVTNNVSATASVSVNAYGLGIFSVALNLCTIGNRILCPVPTYSFSGAGTFPIPEEYASKIPTIAFKIPDLEAVATVQLVDQNQRVVACVTTTLANGHTTYQKGAIWATVGLALLAAGSSLLHSAIPGSVGAAQWRIVDIMAAIQHVAIVSLLSLTYPVAFTSYAANFAWSIGLINIPSLQNSISSTRYATGGDQVGVFGNALEAGVGTSNNDPLATRSLSPQSLVERLSDKDPAALLRTVRFHERSKLTPHNASSLAGALASKLPLLVERIYAPDTGPNGQLLSASEGGPLPLINPNTTAEKGIDLFAERLDIAPANVFLTVLVNYAILLGMLLATLGIIFILARFYTRVGPRRNFAQRFTTKEQFVDSFVWAFVGRYLLIAFPVLLLFAFFQWRNGDSWVPHMVAGITIGIFLFGLATFIVPMFVYAARGGRESLYYPDDEPPAEAGRVPKVWGSFAHPWKPRFFWAYLIFLVWSGIRAAFIAFGAIDGFLQAIGLLCFELVLFVTLCLLRPARNKAGNGVTILLCLSRVLSWAICVAFTTEARVETIPRIIVGYVLLLVTAIPILLLVLLTVIDLFSPLAPRNLRTIKRMDRRRAKREAAAAAASASASGEERAASEVRTEKRESVAPA